MNISWNAFIHLNSKSTRNIVRPIINNISWFMWSLFLSYNVGEGIGILSNEFLQNGSSKGLLCSCFFDVESSFFNNFLLVFISENGSINVLFSMNNTSIGIISFKVCHSEILFCLCEMLWDKFQIIIHLSDWGFNGCNFCYVIGNIIINFCYFFPVVE